MYIFHHPGDLAQRQAPLETIGVAIGTAGRPAFVHLQLAAMERLFGRDFALRMPVHVLCDDDSLLAMQTKRVCERFAGVHFTCWPKMGHSTGDMNIFKLGLEWARAQGVDVLVKLSERFVPLYPWRYALRHLASAHPGAAAFGRCHTDNQRNIFRTDCVALRTSMWQSAHVRETFDEALRQERVCVENIIGSLATANGGRVPWELLGENIYTPAPLAMQWRGCLGSDYADLARWLGLPYGDEDFGDLPDVAPSDWVRQLEAPTLPDVSDSQGRLEAIDDLIRKQCAELRAARGEDPDPGDAGGEGGRDGGGGGVDRPGPDGSGAGEQPGPGSDDSGGGDHAAVCGADLRWEILPGQVREIAGE